MSSTSTYNSDRQSSVDIEFCADPASGSFFSADYKKHDDLKQMLDGNKDSLKLEAMKRIISMVAKGKDASELFPAVVKNVVSSNLEVKKLVYLYLVRYAEEQQDLALLSISTFQRALKDPNPLIRACALRVLSSIRVQVIVPIMMLAIKETVMDLSPYVRKATSHAIPKLYSLDPEQKDELVKVIEKLLSDMSTLVVGSAVMAFEEVCPERIDLIHTNYRKLCCMLVDVEEWGQVIIINMLTRYSRTQFVDPNEGIQAEEIEEKPFYEEDEVKDEKKDEARMDPDHRLLLVNTKPLLLSRNAAVVLAVGQLYQHIGPHAEVAQVAKALVRLLRSHREVQFVVLTNIASLSTQRKGMFEPLLKSFFVRSRDPTQIKVLKLEVMTNIANQTNISLILREFQTYIWSPDKEFVAATIQAIGRCASNIKEVTDTCLSGLVSLLSNKDELVVGESVVVVRKLLQSETVGHKDIITHMARLVDGIKMPTARASILWLLGEYCDKVPKIAPDVLRKMAKSFVNEADMVKLQILTLATKLYLTNPKQTHLLCQYVLNMAKYDNNYDIRDRARFVRALIFPRTDKEEDEGKFSLAKHAHNIFLAPKSAPIQYSNFKERNHLQLGTLSHLINAKATGYTDLPEFPSVAPDPTVRNLKEQVNGSTEKEFHATKTGRTREKLFYSDDEAKNSESESASSDSESDDSSGSDSDMTAGSDSDTASEIEVPKKNTLLIETAKDAVCSSSSSAEDSEDGSSTSASDSSDSDVADAPVETKQTNSLPKKTRNKSPPSKSNLDLLLDLDIGNISIETPVLTPSMGGFLTPNSSKQDENGGPPGSSIKDVSAAYIPVNSVEILNRIAGNGLSVNVRFSRSPHLYSSSMTSIELAFTNHGKDPIKEISLGAKRLTSGMSIHEFSPIPSLGPGSTLHGTIGIDFKDSISSANFDITTADQSFPVSVTPSIGELITPVTMNVADFKHFQNKLRGMNEHIGEVTIEESTGTESQITSRIFNKANVSRVSESSEGAEFWFAGKTCSEKNLVLISVHVDRKDRMKICVNSEKMMVASILFKHLESAFAK